MNSNSESTGMIFNRDGEPFVTFDAAVSIRDLLIGETGAAYRIEQCHAGAGFVVLRPVACSTERSAGNLASKETRGVDTDLLDPMIKPMVFHQALRLYMFHFTFLVAAGYTVFFPVQVCTWVLNALAVKQLPDGLDVRWWVDGLQNISGLIALGLVLTLGYRYLASVYVIGSESVAVRFGLIARESLSIRYSDIRSVGLKQSLVDRLINIGTLEFASAGTGGVDIRFRNIADRKSVV